MLILDSREFGAYLTRSISDPVGSTSGCNLELIDVAHAEQ